MNCKFQYFPWKNSGLVDCAAGQYFVIQHLQLAVQRNGHEIFNVAQADLGTHKLFKYIG